MKLDCDTCIIFKDGNRCKEMCSHLECWDEYLYSIDDYIHLKKD